MLEAAEKLAAASPRTIVFDKKRKAELAAKLAQRWQRWELSNFDYLMQVAVVSPCSKMIMLLLPLASTSSKIIFSRADESPCRWQLGDLYPSLRVFC